MATVLGTQQGIAVSWPGWTSANLDVTVGAFNDAWTPSTDQMDAITAAIVLDAWLNDAGRPWSGSATFTTTLDLSGPPQFVHKIECSASCTYVVDADLQALLDWPASGQTATAIYSTTGVPSMVLCPSDVTVWLPVQAEDGRVSRDGAYTSEPLFAAVKEPQAELIGDEEAAAWLAAAFAGSADPRQAMVYSRSAAAWRTVYIGRVDRQRVGTIYRYALEVFG